MNQVLPTCSYGQPRWVNPFETSHHYRAERRELGELRDLRPSRQLIPGREVVKKFGSYGDQRV